MSDLHEVHFTWPSTQPNVVIVTGTFDQWSSSIHLVKNENGFTGSARIPWGTKIQYKYVVDSNWVCESTSPTETDSAGNVNNVYTSPPKPVVEAVEAGDAAVVTNGAISVTEKPESSAPAVADPAPSEVITTTVTGEAQATAQGGTTFSQLASDFANTVVAADGTSSALGYVASALGAAIQSQIGVDPINSTQIAVETPKPDAQPTIPEPPVAEASPVPAPEASKIAPGVPIAIVPVNAGENNHAATTSAVAAEPEATAAPTSQSVETPSTHTPLPAAIPSPVDASKAVTPSTSVPEVTVEAVTPSENKTTETPVVSVPPVAEAATAAAAAASEGTPVPAVTASAESVVTEPAKPATNGAAPAATESAKPSTNGAAPASTTTEATPVASPAASAPATPAKHAHAFPSSDTASLSSSNTNSPSKGTFGRKKRQSIFGKFKGLFSGDKEEKVKK